MLCSGSPNECEDACALIYIIRTRTRRGSRKRDVDEIDRHRKHLWLPVWLSLWRRRDFHRKIILCSISISVKVDIHLLRVGGRKLCFRHRTLPHTRQLRLHKSDHLLNDHRRESDDGRMSVLHTRVHSTHSNMVINWNVFPSSSRITWITSHTNFFFFHIHSSHLQSRQLLSYEMKKYCHRTKKYEIYRHFFIDNCCDASHHRAQVVLVHNRRPYSYTRFSRECRDLFFINEQSIESEFHWLKNSIHQFWVCHTLHMTMMLIGPPPKRWVEFSIFFLLIERIVGELFEFWYVTFFLWGRESNSRVDWRWSSEPLEFELSYVWRSWVCQRVKFFWIKSSEKTQSRLNSIHCIGVFFWVDIWKIHSQKLFPENEEKFLFFVRMNGKKFFCWRPTVRTSWHSDAKISFEGVHGGVVAFFALRLPLGITYELACVLFQRPRRHWGIRRRCGETFYISTRSRSSHNQSRIAADGNISLKCVYFWILNGKKLTWKTFCKFSFMPKPNFSSDKLITHRNLYTSTIDTRRAGA